MSNWTCYYLANGREWNFTFMAPDAESAKEYVRFCGYSPDEVVIIKK